MNDKELIENAKAAKKAFNEQQKQSVLQMDLKDFLQENITEKSLRTRMINWIYRYQEIVTVGALVKYCQDCDYSHPLLGMRYIGRDCEKAIIDALGKYDIDINKKEAINNNKQESKTTMNKNDILAIMTAIIYAGQHDSKKEHGEPNEIIMYELTAENIMNQVEEFNNPLDDAD